MAARLLGVQAHRDHSDRGRVRSIATLLCLLALSLDAGCRAERPTGAYDRNVSYSFEVECSPTQPAPCGCANCSMVCRKLQSQAPQCTIPCQDEEDCAVVGEDVQCLLFEVGADVGYCTTRQYWWIVGVCMSIAGSLLSNFGLQVQKLAHAKHSDAVAAGLSEPKHTCCLGIWVAGFVAMVTGALLDFGSLLFAAQSLLAPLAACGILINIVQAPCVVGEKPSRADVMTSVIIAAGCTLAIIFSDHDTKTYSLHDLIELWQNWVFATWFIFMTVLMAVEFWVIFKGKQDGDSGRGSRLEESVERGSNVYPLMYGALAGQAGGSSILFAKSIGEVLKTVTQVAMMSAGDIGISMFMVGGLAVCMFVQLKMLNEGLRQFDALFVLPIYQAFWIIGATINGILYFEEYINFSALQYTMFTLGCSLAVGGVLYMALNYEHMSIASAKGLIGGDDAEHSPRNEVSADLSVSAELSATDTSPDAVQTDADDFSKRP